MNIFKKKCLQTFLNKNDPHFYKRNILLFSIKNMEISRLYVVVYIITLNPTIFLVKSFI